MEAVVQIVSLAVVGAILGVLVRERGGALAAAMSLAICGLILFLGLRFCGPILKVVEQLRTLSGLNGAVTAPLLKVVGIGLLTQFAGGICEDAGEKSLGTAVQLSGTVLALYAALPLIQSVLELLEDMLGG